MKNYRKILECIGSHYETPPEDAKGYIFVNLRCHNCNDKMFCDRIRVIIENDINLCKVATIGDRLFEVGTRGFKYDGRITANETRNYRG